MEDFTSIINGPHKGHGDADFPNRELQIQLAAQLEEEGFTQLDGLPLLPMTYRLHEKSVLSNCDTALNTKVPEFQWCLKVHLTTYDVRIII